MADDISLKIVIAITTKSLAPLSKQPSNAHKKNKTNDERKNYLH